MRRRRSGRQARERWVWGRTAAVARLLSSQVGMAAITPRAERIIDLVELRRGGRYLDIGCGTAAYAHMLAQMAGHAEPPVTMDITPGPGPVDLVGWPEKLPFRDQSFDHLTCLYYVRRWDDDVVHALGEEISRVLAPGGTALVMEVAPVVSDGLNRLHTRLLGAGCAEVDLRGWGRLAALFTECGFGAIDLVNVGPFFFPPIPRVGVLLRQFPAEYLAQLEGETGEAAESP
jgi:SAM-dependent methyltransferase